MEFQQLRYFLTIAQTGSFTRAAKVHHVAQPSVSQQILKLESEVGKPLLVRHARGVQLTDAGQVLASRLKHIFSEIDLALKEADNNYGNSHREPSGKVTVAFPRFLLEELAHELLSQCRKYTGLQLNLIQRNSKEAIECIKVGDADFGFAFNPECQPPTIAEPVSAIELFLVGPKTYFQAKGKCTELQFPLLRELPLILRSDTYGPTRIIQATARRTRTRLNVAARLDALSEITNIVERGEGFTITWYREAKRMLRLRKAAMVRIVEPSVYVAVCLVRNQRYDTRGARVVRPIAVALVKRYIESDQFGWHLRSRVSDKP